MDAPQAALRILALEPWLGGSHAAFLEAWARHTDHELVVLGLPARHWKWRMLSGAWELARQIREEGVDPPDVLFVSDYVDLRGLYGSLPAAWAEVPALYYLHENQLTYPSRDDAQPDYSWGFANVLSCARAELVVFNSRYHRDEFRTAGLELLRRLPHPNPRADYERALASAQVVYPGVEWEALRLGAGAEGPLRVLYSHRWEHDKDPLGFLRAAARAVEEGARLELVLLGEDYEELPEGCGALLDALAPHIAQRGFLPDRDAYRACLASCDLVVSTARHEFFGIAAVEALAAGCHPLLPSRLCYPEWLPEDLHASGLYAGEEELVRRLREHAARPEALRDPAHRAALREAVRPLSVVESSRALDGLALRVARGQERDGGRPPG